MPARAGIAYTHAGHPDRAGRRGDHHDHHRLDKAVSGQLTHRQTRVASVIGDVMAFLVRLRGFVIGVTFCMSSS